MNEKLNMKMSLSEDKKKNPTKAQSIFLLKVSLLFCFAADILEIIETSQSIRFDWI